MVVKTQPKPQTPYPKSYTIFREGKYRAVRKNLNTSLRFVTINDISKSNELCFCPLGFSSYHYKLQFIHKDKTITMCPILIALGRQRLYFHKAADDNLDVGELIRMSK